MYYSALKSSSSWKSVFINLTSYNDDQDDDKRECSVERLQARCDAALRV